MTLDEYEQKIISIRKRGLNILLENELIAIIRKEYYEELMFQNLQYISETLRKNVSMLNQMHGENCSANKIKEFMGLETETHLNKILYENRNINSLRSAMMISEFFGLPVEMLLFQDLTINPEHVKKEYGHLFKQNKR